MQQLIEKMEKVLESTRKHFGSVRTGRANPDILAHVVVEYYGSFVPLKQMASVTVPEPQLLQLNVFDAQSVKSIEKAIQTSDLNLNPQTEGTVIRLRLPDLTQDRRKELVKLVRKYAEEAKVALRNVRRSYIDELKAQEKNGEISEDDSKKSQDNAQKEIDRFSNEVDEMVKKKESEIMTV